MVDHLHVFVGEWGSIPASPPIRDTLLNPNQVSTLGVGGVINPLRYLSEAGIYDEKAGIYDEKAGDRDR